MRWTIGLAAVFLAAGPALAGDPFEDARYAIGIKQNDAVLAAIDSGAVAINARNAEGYTLLHYAADANNATMVEALLARGADPSIKANSGSTAYDMATSSAIKLRLASAKTAPPPAPAQDTATAAAPAATPSGTGICAAVRAETVNDGRSPVLRPLLRARDSIWYNHPDQLAALLDECVSANAKDPSGSTLLHVAADRDRVDAAKILLARGASRSIADATGKLAADYATSAEMKALLGGGTAAAPSSAANASADRRKDCKAKWAADDTLAYGDTDKMIAKRKWGQCLRTGLYQ